MPSRAYSKNVFERNHGLTRSSSIVRKLSLWPQIEIRPIFRFFTANNLSMKRPFEQDLAGRATLCGANLKSEIENWA
jgi:hypothetical protein